MIVGDPNFVPGLELEPEANVVVHDGRTIATSAEPWLRFKSLEGFRKTRFVEIVYRSSLYDDPVRPVLRFCTPKGEVERILPGPVAGLGLWRGAVPRGIDNVLICPAARIGPFDFRIEGVSPLGVLDILKLVWVRRPKKLFDIVLASTFGFFAEAENAVDWAIGAEPLDRFPEWSARRERALDLSGIDKPRIDWREGPNYVVFIDARDAAKGAVARTIASLRDQVYEKFNAIAIGSPDVEEEFGAALDPRVIRADDAAVGWADFGRERFVLFLRAGDALVPHALALVTEELARAPSTKLLYGDELVEAGGRPTVLFKPDWSPLFNAARSYLGRSLVVSASMLSGCAPPLDAAEFQRHARVIASGLARNEIVHLRRWLLCRADEEAALPAEPRRVAEPAGETPKPPSVSVVLPTKDRAELLEPCLDSVLRLSSHPCFEALVVDNGTRQAKALSILEQAAHDSRVRIIRRPGPFNYAAFNNQAAQAATGDVLVFLNNDTVVLSPDWLEQLCELAVDDRIGAVGCLLLYPNGLIQHAGVVVGLGQDAGHFEALQTPAAPSWLDRTRSLRETSGVTAACLAVQRSKFLAAGGFDEGNLPIEFNDIDLCLRLAERGWTTCYTPHVRLMHKESATRGAATARPLDVYARERAYFRARWRAVIRDDPYFHPGLSLYSRRTALS